MWYIVWSVCICSCPTCDVLCSIICVHVCLGGFWSQHGGERDDHFPSQDPRSLTLAYLAWALPAGYAPWVQTENLAMLQQVCASAGPLSLDRCHHGKVAYHVSWLWVNPGTWD